MNKLLIPFLVFPLSLSVSGVEMPERTMDGDYENINQRKEYRYDVYPGLVFWNEGGRPFWKEVDSKTTSSNRDNHNHMRKNSYNRDSKKVHFTMAEADLDSRDKRRLAVIAREVRNGRDVDHIVINGFASKPGSKDFNMELSKERAENVRRYLISKGVNNSQITTQAFGEKMPMPTREQSRRVEIYIR